MKLLILHNRYQRAGGEDAVVTNETAMLRAAGHDVHLELVSNDSIGGLGSKVRTLLATPYDARRTTWMHELLERTGADLVHIHNFFPLLTPAVHEAAAAHGVPVVQTLHNYRLICAGAMLMRDGEVCETCVSGNRAAAVVHRCYRGSVAGSAAVVAMQNRAARAGTWGRAVTRFIALTEFARQKFIEGGLPAERIVVKPNALTAPALSDGRRSGALFVGRLSPEKGAAVLLRAWREVSGMALTVIGDGPERAALEAMAPDNVTFFGQLGPDKVAEHMRSAQMLIVPSVWYEGFPMTIIEAFAAGLPVIASDLGSLREIVTDGVLGRRFAPKDHAALAGIINSAAAQPEQLAAWGRAARAAYEQRYTAAQNLTMLEAIYRDVLTERRPRLTPSAA
jgi:glycosyltransferase involved in cell wall biosynthesis